jgi:hypothetical protein
MQESFKNLASAVKATDVLFYNCAVAALKASHGSVTFSKVDKYMTYSFDDCFMSSLLQKYRKPFNLAYCGKVAGDNRARAAWSHNLKRVTQYTIYILSSGCCGDHFG